MKRFTLLVLTSLLFLHVSCANKKMLQKGKTYVLVTKYKKGKAYEYKTSVNIQSTMEMGSMSPTVNILTDMRYSFEIRDKRADTVFLDVKINDVNMSMKTAAGLKNIPDIEQFKGKKIGMVLLNNGTVVKVDTPSHSGKSIEALVEAASHMFRFLPNTPVKLNDTWTDTMENGVYNYILKKVSIENNDTVATIGINFMISKETTEEKRGMKVKSKLKGKGEGKMEFSVTNGVILLEESSLGLEGKAHMEGGMAQGGMDIPIYVDQSAETKLMREE